LGVVEKMRATMNYSSKGYTGGGGMRRIPISLKMGPYTAVKMHIEIKVAFGCM